MRRKQIIDEAFRLFARHGYDSATMRQIGSAVGLDKSSLYVHFKNKNEIFEAIIKSELEQYEQNVLNSMHQVSLKTLVHNLFIETVTYFSDRDKLLFWKHICLLAASGADAEVNRQAEAALECVHRLIRSKLETEQKMTREDRLSKTMLRLFILTQGFLDWLLIQEEIDTHTMKMAEELFDSVFGNTVL